MPLTEQQVMDVLHNCYDPEIPINIVDLGLIYGVQVEGNNVHVKMTLTAQGCPAHGMISDQVKYQLSQIPGIGESNVEIVWDPPWDPSRMSTEAKQKLGIGL